MTDCASEDIVIQPRRGKNEKPVPENGILLVNPSEASECLDRLREGGAENRFLFNSGLVIAGEQHFFAAGPALGSPMAALTLEKLIALGARRIILFGWCGAISPMLRIGDVLVPAAALSGEGTSSYYCPDGELGPEDKLQSELAQVFSDNGFAVRPDCVWSTDAVYREDRNMLNKLSRENCVGAVDMEFSALCAVARFRKVQFAAVLIVSDELWGKKWNPGFSQQHFTEQKQAALNVLLANIGYLGEQ